MAAHYHVIDSQTGDDYAEHYDEKQDAVVYAATLTEARQALADAKWGYEGPDVWVLGSLRDGAIYIYDRRHYSRRSDCPELDFDAMVSICVCGVPGVEGMCDE